MRAALAVALVSLFSLLASPVSLVAGQAVRLPHIETWKIVEQDTQVDRTNRTLVAGGVYVASFKIVVDVDLPESDLILFTSLEKVEDTLWKLRSVYPGINTTTWQPGAQAITLKTIKGTAEMTLTGRVPSNLTVQRIDTTLELRKERAFTIVTLLLASTQEVIDRRTATVTDARIIEFDTKFQEKNATYAKTPADPKFKTFYAAMLSVAQALRAAGNIDLGLSLVNGLPAAAGFIEPPEAGMFFIYSSVGLAGLAVLLAALLVRTRSGREFVHRQVGDKAKDLDLLLVRLSRIDKAAADEVARIKNDLDKISKREG